MGGRKGLINFRAATNPCVAALFDIASLVFSIRISLPAIHCGAKSLRVKTPEALIHKTEISRVLFD